MLVSYVSQMDTKVASYRYRMLIPGAELEKLGHEVFVGPLPWHEADLVVFAKDFNPNEIAMAKIAKSRGAKVVYDLCNWVENEHYRLMCEIADDLVTTCDPLAEIIREKTGKRPWVIDDPYEFPAREPHFKADPLRLLWYGHKSNLQSFSDLVPSLRGLDAEVEVISNRAAPMITQWSPSAVKDGLARADIVMITTSHGDINSANRITEAANGGCFVVAQPLTSYKPYADSMWLGDIRDGIDWAVAHKDEINDRIKAAQIVAARDFSPSLIAEKWEQVFKYRPLITGTN